MASRMLDLPLPLRPVIELKLSSLLRSVSYALIDLKSPRSYHPEITVLTAYDLKPYSARGHVSSAVIRSCRITRWVWSRLMARWKNTYVDDDFGNPHFGVVVIVVEGSSCG